MPPGATFLRLVSLEHEGPLHEGELAPHCRTRAACCSFVGACRSSSPAWVGGLRGGGPRARGRLPSSFSSFQNFLSSFLLRVEHMYTSTDADIFYSLFSKSQKSCQKCTLRTKNSPPPLRSDFNTGRTEKEATDTSSQPQFSQP